MAEKKTWADLTPSQKRRIYVTGAVEAVVTTIALVDLKRRPASSVRGRKWAWVLSFLVQPFGPIGYLLYGRRPAHETDAVEQ